MNRQHAWHHPTRWGSAVLVWALMAQMVVPAQAFVSQLPGAYTTPPDVNVMFTLDDSGSMYSEAIPDYDRAVNGMPTDDLSSGLSGDFGSKYPALWYERVTKKAGLQSSAYLSPPYYSLSNHIARFIRSAAGNPLYYNPDVRYQPWPTAADDTKLNAAANPSAVNIHPADPFNAGQQIDIKTRRGAAGLDDETKNFWPATYFVYKGKQPLTTADMQEGGNNVDKNFKKIEIKPDVTFYAHSPGRTDCIALAFCTYDEEIQNFANWLQYYHSRMLMAKGGVAAAFARQGTNLRVGFGTINSDNAVRLGVAQFKAPNRENFYNEMYPREQIGSTPLREAADKVGQYFTSTGLQNPWAEDPTNTATVGKEHECRRSFHILSTDGFWNGNPAQSAINDANIDDFAGKTTPDKPNGVAGETYSDASTATFGISPFADGVTSTLSDVAAYYWREDLRTGMDNRVVPSTRDPAYWQHLTTYTIGLGITGSGTVTATYNGVTGATVPTGLPDGDPLKGYEGKRWLDSQALREALVANKVKVNWPQVDSESPQTGDDLVHASMVGRGKYFSATNPTDLANGLAAALAEAADQQLTFASLAVDSQQLIAGGKAYQATFNPSGWYGRLYAFKQAADGTIKNTPSTVTTPNPDQVWEASNKMPAAASRSIFTSRGGVGTGTLFLWDNLTTAQKADLANDSTMLDFLRGDAKYEMANGGNFRDRARYRLGTTAGGVLGDVVGSAPLKGPDAGGGYDRLPTGGTSGQATYASFRSASGPLDDMRNTMFVGANDGMLHAFNLTDGVERFAYVPSTVYNVPRSTSGGLAEPKLRMLSEPGYTHRFTVDGSPNVADVYFGGSWHSVLVGSTGAGARGIFAMDVTKTAAGSGGFDSSKIMWEFTEADSKDMGFVLAYPHAVRMRNDQWAVITGNGYDSESGNAVLFIRDAATGAKIQEFAVDSTGGNGLSQPNFVLNETREVIAIYAGDLKGNLWKFDVSSTSASSWGPVFGSSPLFTAVNSGGKAQPISVMPEISAHPNGGAILIFGTGKLFESSDTANDSSNVNLGTQTIYGVWDRPLETTGVGMTTGNRATLLQEQKFSAIVGSDPATLRRTTAYTPEWSTQRGWFLDLEGSGERANLPAQQFRSVVVVATNTPATNDPCASGGASKIFVFDPVTGSAPAFPVFDTNNDKKINSTDLGPNVLLNGSALLTQPVIQLAASSGGAGATGPTVQPIGAFDRGQATAARPGGVELARASGSKTASTGSGGSANDCDAAMSAAQSNTDLLQLLFRGCAPGKPRISWRQLK
jgi:type IV pilus assembly protein PilY1